MDQPTQPPSTSTIRPPSPGRTPLNRWILSIIIIGILVVGVLFSLIYFQTAQVSTRNFVYNPPPDSSGSYNSLSISDVDGIVNILPWSQPIVRFNVTITARGLGSVLSTVSITNSSNNGDVFFGASFPVSGGFFFSQSYTVGINVFVPSTIRLQSVLVSDSNGAIRVSNLNATVVNLATVNGAIAISCAYCLNMTGSSTGGNITGGFSSLLPRGNYNLTTTNANIFFSAPSSSSFKLTAKGSVSCTYPGCNSSGQGSFTQIFGMGSAIVSLSSTFGQIAISAT